MRPRYTYHRTITIIRAGRKCQEVDSNKINVAEPTPEQLADTGALDGVPCITPAEWDRRAAASVERMTAAAAMYGVQVNDNLRHHNAGNLGKMIPIRITQPGRRGMVFNGTQATTRATGMALATMKRIARGIPSRKYPGWCVETGAVVSIMSPMKESPA
jgi:hypothetical protein